MAYQLFPRTLYSEQIIEELARIDYIFTDLDGTMFHQASAIKNSQGLFSSALAQTICDMHMCGLSIVPCTGRNRAQIRETCRMLGISGWIAELGGILHLSGEAQDETEYFCAEMDFDQTRDTTPHDAIQRTGVVERILKRWDGMVETHNDNGLGYQYREVTIGMRGCIDEDEAQVMLDQTGLNLYLSDNGLVPSITGKTTLRCDREHPKNIHSYHIAPKGLNKGSGAARYIARAGWDRRRVLCCGDSPADIDMANVGRFFLLYGKWS